VARGNLIMVTSALAGEGKTHTAFNLALNVAREHDYTVLLVDADVIKRDTSTLLGIADRPGLMDLLSDDKLHVGDTLLRTDTSHLVVLPAGKYQAQATELLASREMQRLVSELSNRYPDRIILFDSPPLLATAEAQVLAGLMGQVVLVVEAGRTPQSVVEDAIATLNTSQAIGLVLNKNQQSLGGDSYGGYYKYQA
jgi:protein-tyrosine kinase